MTVDLRGVAYAASRISSTLKGSTKQFGWLQAPATKISFLSIISANPATIRICLLGDCNDSCDGVRPPPCLLRKVVLLLCCSHVAASVGRISARNKSLTSLGGSGLLFSIHQFSTRINVEAAY